MGHTAGLSGFAETMDPTELADWETLRGESSSDKSRGGSRARHRATTR